MIDFWYDKEKHGHLLLSGYIPDGAVWATQVVLKYYKDHFDWGMRFIEFYLKGYIDIRPFKIFKILYQVLLQYS